MREEPVTKTSRRSFSKSREARAKEEFQKIFRMHLVTIAEKAGTTTDPSIRI